MTVSVLTATIPSRQLMLREAMTSVLNQDRRPESHLIFTDFKLKGPGAVYRDLLYASQSEWVMMLDDDDLLDRNHLSVLEGSIFDDPAVDVAYSWCRTDGDDFHSYNRSFDHEDLHHHNIVSVTALFRRELALDIGGISDRKGHDWLLWLALEQAGARFRCVPEITWTYRLHSTPEQKNYSRDGVSV